MEEKSGISPSGVMTVKGGDEASLPSRTEFQQNPSFLQFVGPTTVVSPPAPVPVSAPAPVPTTLTPGSAPPPPSISSGGSDPAKKKRGRPRKYAPDGSLNPRALRPTLSPTPISSSIPLSGDYNWKRGKAQQQYQHPHQPVEFVKKSHKFEYETSPVHAPSPPPPPPPGLSCYVGANFTTHQFTVNAGEDVTMKVMPYSQGSRAICILSATGSISNVTLRQPTTSGGTLTYEGRFEILSLCGSFMPTESGGTKGRSGGMSISLAGPNGRIIGGGLAGMLIAAGPVQVIMGSFIVMHQAEQNQQKKKPRMMEAYAAPPPPPQQQQQPQPPQQQPPTFTITNVNSSPPVVSTVEESKQQPYSGGGGIVRPMAQMPSSFHNDNPPMNNFQTPYHGYGNMNVAANKEEDDYDDGGDDDSGDTRSLSNSG